VTRLLLLVPLLLVSCIDPADRRPGLWLSGEVVSGPVGDWSFSDAQREIFVETRSRFGFAHSVTVLCAQREGQLYIGAREPEGKSWVANIGRNPDVRIEIDGKLYEQRLERVEDAEEIAAIYAAYAQKYGFERVPPEERPEVWYYRVVEPAGAA
jgi:hypothetical protein